MNTIVLTASVVALFGLSVALFVGVPLAVYLRYRYYKAQADRVYSYRLSEYRRLDTYPHNPDVEVRPLTRRDIMSIGEDLD